MCLFILTTMASAKYWAELSSKSLPEIMIKLIDILIKLIDTEIKLRDNKLDEQKEDQNWFSRPIIA